MTLMIKLIEKKAKSKTKQNYCVSKISLKSTIQPKLDKPS